jgi:hypothetical protein
MFSTAKQTISCGIANMGVFVFIWLIFKSFVSGSYSYTFEVIPTGKRFS